MKCKTCDHEADPAAEVCYNCGRKTPVWVRNAFEGMDAEELKYGCLGMILLPIVGLIIAWLVFGVLLH